MAKSKFWRPTMKPKFQNKIIAAARIRKDEVKSHLNDTNNWQYLP